MEDQSKGKDNKHAGAKKGVGVYESSEDALKELQDAFNYWSGQVTTTSVQMCYAVIGANWVVFGSVGNILASRWAIASLITVLLALTLNMVSSLGFAEWMRCRFDWADRNRRKWDEQFNEEKKKHSTWPYSDAIEKLGIAMRYARVLVPLASGVLLIIGAIFTHR